MLLTLSVTAEATEMSEAIELEEGCFTSLSFPAVLPC